MYAMSTTRERPPLNDCITEMVRLLTARNHLRQADLARYLHMDKAVITRAFKGQRDWKASEVDQLAELFDVDREVLLSDPDDRIPARVQQMNTSRWTELSLVAA